MASTRNIFTRFSSIVLAACLCLCFATSVMAKRVADLSDSFAIPLTWNTTIPLSSTACSQPVGVAAIEPWMSMAQSIESIWACARTSPDTFPMLVTLFVNGSTAATPVTACTNIGQITLDPVVEQILVSCIDVNPSIVAAPLVLIYTLPLYASQTGVILLSGNECEGATGVSSMLVDWSTGDQFLVCRMPISNDKQADSVWSTSKLGSQPSLFFQSDNCTTISSVAVQYTGAPQSYGQILVGCNCTDNGGQSDQYALLAVNMTGGAYVPFATPAECSGSVQVYGSYDPGNLFFIACPLTPSATIVATYSPYWGASVPMLTSADCANPNRILVDPFSDWVYISCAGNQTILAFDSALPSSWYGVDTLNRPHSCSANQLSVSSTSATSDPNLILFVACGASEDGTLTLRVNMTSNLFEPVTTSLFSLDEM